MAIADVMQEKIEPAVQPEKSSEPLPPDLYPDQQSGEDSAPVEAGDPSQGGEEKATPEEQEALEKVVTAAMSILYDKQASGPIMEMLSARSDDPAQAIADASTKLLLGIDEQSGGTMPEVVILPAGAEIVPMVGEFARDSGVIPSVDENVVGRAGQLMIAAVSQEYGVSEEEIDDLLASTPENEIASMVEQQSKFAGVQESE